MGLRPLRRRDAQAWQEVRQRNWDWLRPWEATQPPDIAHLGQLSIPQLLRSFRREATQGRMLPFVITYRDTFVGQLTVSGITWGSSCSGQLGYWLDEKVAGRGIMPTAVALVVDHCFSTVHLHRVEVNICPDNMASRRVVEKLGFREEGLRRRYLHINGIWRDHVAYSLTVEEVAEGLLKRWRCRQGTLP